MSDIQMTKQEMTAFNVLNSTVINCETAYKESIEARGAYLELVGLKYHAVFDPQTGKFELTEGKDES